MSVTFEKVRKIALSLSDVEESTSYGTPAFKVKGKLFLRLHQDDKSLIVRMNFDQREDLIALNPDTYYITEHYKNYEWILVRLSHVKLNELRELIESAWRSRTPTKKKKTKLPSSPAPLALEIDHIIVKADHARESFDFFKDTLSLPVVSDFKVIVPGVFSSGSVSVGNLHIECAQVGPGTGFSIPPMGQAAFGGFCMAADRNFGPNDILDRGLVCEIIAPPGADGKPMFTNYKLLALSNPDEQFSLTVHRETFDPIERKRRNESELLNRKGGPLGIIRADEIIVGTKEIKAACQTWLQLLGKPIAPGQWQLTKKDPILTVVKGKHHSKILAVRILVKSLKKAVAHLKLHDALGKDSDGNVLVKGPHSADLRIMLFE